MDVGICMVWMWRIWIDEFVAFDFVVFYIEKMVNNQPVWPPQNAVI